MRVPPSRRSRWITEILPPLLGAGLVLVLLVWLGRPDPATYRLLPALAAFGVLVGLVLLFYPLHRPVVGFGAANVATLTRGIAAVWLAGLYGAGPGSAAAGWLIAGVGLAALALDALDGRLARARGTVSAFGARFDMEVDALLLLVLSLLAFDAGRAGPWVLAIGLMRYAFVAAGLILPALRQPLPESFRRKLVCVIQGIALTLGFVPVLPQAAAGALLGLALAALAGSFLADTVHLLRRRVAAGPAGAAGT